MSGFHVLSQKVGFGGEKVQEGLYHIPALGWNVRMLFGRCLLLQGFENFDS